MKKRDEPLNWVMEERVPLLVPLRGRRLKEKRKSVPSPVTVEFKNFEARRMCIVNQNYWGFCFKNLGRGILIFEI